MKSNGTKMGALQLAQIATILGAVVWAAGLFSNYAIIPFRGLYLFFAVMSVVQLVLSLKIAGISRETEGDPLKTSVTACIICFVLQILFFGALVVLGPEALPWAQRVFLTMVALYIVPAFVYYAAKVNKL